MLGNLKEIAESVGFELRASELKRVIIFVLGMLLLVSGTWRVTQAANGDLDPTFGNGGKVVTDFSSSTDWLSRIAIQPDGKIIAIGDTHPSHRGALSRYNPDGTLDPTFGNGGKVITVANVRESAAGLLILPNGKIMISGSIDLPSSSNSSFALLRFNADGSVDSTFGNGGLVTTNIGIDDDRAYSIALQSDGKIVAAGRRGIQFYPSEQRKGNVALARYNPDGSLDTTFGNGGIVINDFGQGLESYAIELIIQPDGKLVIAGESSYRFLVARYNSDGTLDSTFGDSGHAFGNFSSNWDGATDAALQPDGKIILVGWSVLNSPYDSFAMARFNSDGSLDQTFGNGGKVLIPNEGDLEAVALQSDGKVIALGSSDSFVLLRFNVNGSLDPTFGSGGTVATSFGGAAAAGGDLVFQADGKFLAGGYTSTDIYFTNSDFALARYMDTPNTVSRPTQFDFDGDHKADSSIFRDGMWYLQQSTDDFAAIQFGLPSDKLAPADYDGDGKTDIAVYRDGTWYLLRSAGGFTSYQFGLSGDTPVPADFTGDGRAELAVYRAGSWYTMDLVNNQITSVQFGTSTDKPVVGDFDGDGRSDYAVYRDGTWYVLESTQGFKAVKFGISSDKPVVGDYDGDGKSDMVVYRPTEGTWYLLRSQMGFTSFQFGNPNDRLVPADYDGDGKTDPAVFRAGVWYLLPSAQGGISIIQFGMSNDIPIPGAFRP